MADSLKRKDKKGRILKTGESQRKDGRYIYKYTDPRTGIKKIVYSWKLDKYDKVPKGKKDCLSIREQKEIIENNIKKGIIIDNKKETVAELVERYINGKNVRPSTRNCHVSILNKLKEDSLGNMVIDTITTKQAKEWLKKKQDEGCSYSYVQNYRSVLRPAFRMAFEEDLIRKNPFDFKIEGIVKNDSVKRDAITPQQQEQFLNFVKEDGYFSQFYNGMVILFETGLRISELCGLTLDDIDLAEKKFSVNKQLLYTAVKHGYVFNSTKTRAGIRTLPMSDKAYEAFKNAVENRATPKKEIVVDGVSNFLFLNTKDRPMYSYHWEMEFRYVLQKYNDTHTEQLPKITPHIARHTFCTNMVNKKITPKTLQYLMGHEDIRTTLNVYTHIDFDNIKEEFDAIA